MKTSGLLTTAMAAVLLVGIWAAPSQGLAAAPGSKTGAAPKAETYMVVKVTPGDEFRVIQSSTFKNEQKKIEDEYKAAAQKYKDDKSAAAKSKEKFEQPKPVKRKLTTIKAGCKTEQEATDWMEKCKADPKFEKKTADG